MAKTALARTTDLDPIDRLEDKVKLLVSLVTQLRTEQAEAAEEHTRLRHEIQTLRGRLADAEGAGSELAALRDERNVIRDRVTEMLHQIEHLSL